MRLPGHQRAVIDPKKPVDYCLNPSHDKGKHKARVFRSTFGITAAQWMQLRDAIVDAIEKDEAFAGAARAGVVAPELFQQFFLPDHAVAALDVRFGWVSAAAFAGPLKTAPRPRSDRDDA